MGHQSPSSSSSKPRNRDGSKESGSARKTASKESSRHHEQRSPAPMAHSSYPQQMHHPPLPPRQVMSPSPPMYGSQGSGSQTLAPYGQMPQGAMTQQVTHHVYSSTPSPGVYSSSVSVGGQVYHSRQVSGTDAILNERIVEHEIKVPKRIVREDVIEKVVVVPEKRVREEVVDEVYNVREKVVEVMKPIIQERIVEVPEIEYVEREVEVPEYIIQEKILERPVIRYEERIVHVPKIIEQEKIVEVPTVEYREVPVEKIIEVAEYREEIRHIEVPKTQYIDKPYPEPVVVEVPQKKEHKIPVPIEAISTFAYKMPKLQPNYSSVDLTLYVPRFIEVPVPAEFMEAGALRQAEALSLQVNKLAQQQAASLCEVETLASQIKTADFNGVLDGTTDFTASLTQAWRDGRLRTAAC